MNGNSRMSIILIVFTFEQKTEKKGVHSLQWDKNGKTVQKKCVVARLFLIDKTSLFKNIYDKM